MSGTPKSIFRFRDLATNLGETIENHNDIIKNHNQAWWAWWAKSNERPPQLFGEIKDEYVYLFDSGQSKLYRVKVGRINSSSKKHSSPNPELTPAYYNKINYYAWLELVSPIVEVPIGEIYEFSYVNEPTLFEEHPDVFNVFGDKVICSARELREQERTVWRIRPSRSDDKSHEIITLNYKPYQLENLSSTPYVNTGTKHAVWLSDMHFGTDHGYPVVNGVTGQTLFTQLSSVLDKCSIKKPLFLLGGDFATKCEQGAFEQAKSFIKSLTSGIQGEVENYLYIPGNHDTRVEAETPTMDQGANVEDYRRFIKETFNNDINEYGCMSRRYLLSNMRVVEFICLNTSRLPQLKGAKETGLDFMGHSYVGLDQLEHIKGVIGAKGKPKNLTRIVLMHHNYAPTNYSERVDFGYSYSAVLDGERVIRWCLENDVDVIIHGHQHTSFYSKITRPVDLLSEEVKTQKEVHIIGVGSCGVKKECLPASESNEFLVINFEEDEMECIFYQLDNDGKLNGREKARLNLTYR